MSSSQQHSDPRKNTMVGGYSSLAHDEQVVKVANFALNEHAAKSSSSSVSGSDELSLSVSQEQVDSGEVTAVVLEAQRQVSLLLSLLSTFFTVGHTTERGWK